MSRESLAKVYPLIDSRDAELLESLYGASEPVETCPLSHARTGQAGRQAIEGYDLYAVFFREGILFVYVPAGIRDDSTLEILSRRHQVIHDLLERRLPFLTHVAVLVADLQDSTRICAELPPEEYFALVNEIWGSTESIFLKYHGVHGKHSGDGIVYYFFPQPDSNYVLNAIRCSHELKQQMREVSRSWRTRKNWLEELCLNIGLNEGREWFGTYPTNVEFTVLGDTINHAGRLSDFATDGSIWVTKSMLITLSTEEREQLRYGIQRRTENGDEVLVSNFYSSISEMLDPTNERYARFHAIAHLAVSEITDVLDGDTPS